MADTAIAITAGTGTNVDTRTEGTNGNHRQVVVLGDPATNAGVAPVDATNGLSVNVTNASLTVAAHAVTNAGTFAVQPAGSVAHDGAGTSVNPVLAGGYASAAAPTDVSADGDSVRAWYLRNGAQAAVITAAGALVGGDATNGLDVDVTRIIPGTSATHLGKAIDSAAGATDTGVTALVVRDDALSTLTPVDGDYTVLRTTSTGALWVQDASLNSNGQAVAANSSPVVIASDRQNSVAFSVAMSTDTSAYASGDLIADTQQLDAFFNKTDGRGVVNSITIIDQDNQGVALYIMFHSTSTSMGTENSAPNISDANLAAGLLGIVAVATTDYVTVSGAKVACIKNIGLPVKAVSGTDDLYVSVLNSTGTPTYTATGLNLTIGALLD